MDKWIEENKKIISEFKPTIGIFEKDQLLPELVNRLKYIKERMEQFVQICDDMPTAIRLDESLRSVLDPKYFDPKSNEPLVGIKYLSDIKMMILESYIKPINRLSS
jgi:hypothetical protein